MPGPAMPVSLEKVNTNKETEADEHLLFLSLPGAGTASSQVIGGEDRRGATRTEDRQILTNTSEAYLGVSFQDMLLTSRTGGHTSHLQAKF